MCFFIRYSIHRARNHLNPNFSGTTDQFELKFHRDSRKNISFRFLVLFCILEPSVFVQMDFMVKNQQLYAKYYYCLQVVKVRLELTCNQLLFLQGISLRRYLTRRFTYEYSTQTLLSVVGVRFDASLFGFYTYLRAGEQGTRTPTSISKPIHI